MLHHRRLEQCFEDVPRIVHKAKTPNESGTIRESNKRLYTQKVHAMPAKSRIGSPHDVTFDLSNPAAPPHPLPPEIPPDLPAVAVASRSRAPDGSSRDPDSAAPAAAKGPRKLHLRATRDASPRSGRRRRSPPPSDVCVHVVQFGSPIIYRKTPLPFVPSHRPRSQFAPVEQRRELRRDVVLLQSRLRSRRQLRLSPSGREQEEVVRGTIEQFEKA
jgi:hypothetical protein